MASSRRRKRRMRVQGESAIETVRIPIRISTWKRLRAFRGRRSTYDEAVNELLRSVPVERVGPRTLRLIRRRMATRRGRGIDWRKVREELGD